MRTKMLGAAAFAAALILPAMAQAQGVVGGANEGAYVGERDAGPVGAVIGGTIGGVVGGINGVLGIDQRPRVREYVVRENRPVYTYDGEVAMGAVVSDPSMPVYVMPSEYGGYTYSRVNGRTIILDPRTRRVIDTMD